MENFRSLVREGYLVKNLKNAFQSAPLRMDKSEIYRILVNLRILSNLFFEGDSFCFPAFFLTAVE